MKNILTLGALLVFAIHNIAFAEGGSDRLIERMAVRAQALPGDQQNAENNIGNTVKSEGESAGNDVRNTVKSEEGDPSERG
ncbi:hypothetical protein [Pseudomonas]|uniref:Secreted protein n=1 Tax=Pseudomonas wadenswilerensis TaxID=1785161 RepID=A0A380T6X4_9PSED|nr:hypothetical protein [Pseudomonas]UVM24448.1 hypothetical protein LOY45_13095 [Pseudomonas wadenswilerensis]SPO66785.1 conserved exported protein of unknown function [Pseudomonas sp. JV241A]SUQ65962.1 hypothetical protein CCOS864_05442 [Pseudomonas wadenswilerensis]